MNFGKFLRTPSFRKPLNTEKYGPGKTLYLDTFHSVSGAILVLRLNIYLISFFRLRWYKVVELSLPSVSPRKSLNLYMLLARPIHKA